MTIQNEWSTDLEVMPVEVFRGAGTNLLVLLQEWPSIEAEHYVRIMVPLRDAQELARNILNAYEDARHGG